MTLPSALSLSPPLREVTSSNYYLFKESVHPLHRIWIILSGWCYSQIHLTDSKIGLEHMEKCYWYIIPNSPFVQLLPVSITLHYHLQLVDLFLFIKVFLMKEHYCNHQKSRSTALWIRGQVGLCWLKCFALPHIFWQLLLLPFHSSLNYSHRKDSCATNKAVSGQGPLWTYNSVVMSLQTLFP